jgi:dTDP-4-amino-4,6-dideoxygalactose transaminase
MQVKNISIPFSKVQLSGNELKYLKEVLKSGWLTTAKKAIIFEQKFADFLGVKFACAVNSCTSALHLGMEAIGVKAGDKVFVQSMTFTASAEVIRYLGAHPVFLDVEYGTCLINPEILKDAIKKNPEVKFLVVVHYGGQSALMSSINTEGILDICNKHGIKIIEDAAHAFPSRCNGTLVGNFGDVTCFSFYANKTITTGEGGMLVTNDPTIYERVKIMRLHGINRDVWNRFTSLKSSWEYDVIAPGFKYNISDINAAIGLAQLEKAEYFRELRERCAKSYFVQLSKLPLIDLPRYRGELKDHAWHLFPIVIQPDAPIQRNEFINFMAQNGVGTSVHYKPLHRMSYYKNTYNLSPSDFPTTERIWNGTVSLPIYPGLRERDVRTICRIIEKAMILS